MMRKISLKSAGFAVLGAGFVLVLLACAKPVDLKGFLDDDIIQGIIKGRDTGVEGIDPVPDAVPKLKAGETTGTLSEGETVTLAKTPTPDSITIKVANADDYDAGSIKWYCNSGIALTTSDGVEGTNYSELAVTAGAGPFSEVRTYHVSVVGQIGGKPYSTYVFIKVVD